MAPYSTARRSLKALPITDTELKVMAALAIIGLSNSPSRASKRVTQPLDVHYTPVLPPAQAALPIVGTTGNATGTGPHFTNWPGFASNLALQPFEQK